MSAGLDQRTIGRHLVLERVEAAPGCVTYKAWSVRFFRRVFLRWFPQGSLPDPLLQSLHGLCARLAHWRHPHVLPVIDYGVWQGGFFVVTPLLRASLAARMRAGPVARATGLQWARQVAGVLDAAQSLHLQHGHLIPENVLFDRDGEVRVADFGIAAYKRLARQHAEQSLGMPQDEDLLLEALEAQSAHLPDRDALAGLLIDMLSGVNRNWSAVDASGGNARRASPSSGDVAGEDATRLSFEDLVDRLEAANPPERLHAGRPLASRVIEAGTRSRRSAVTPVQTPEPALDLMPIDLPSRRPIVTAIAAASLILLLGAGGALYGPRLAASLIRPSVAIPGTGEATAWVETVAGDARVRPAGLPIPLPLLAQAEVRARDEFHTGPDGQVLLRLDPSVSVRIYANSVVSVVSIGGASDPITWLEVIQGVVVLAFDPNHDLRQVVVLTPWGTASMTGSVMGIHVQDGPGTLAVACFTGDCSVNLRSRPARVAPGTVLTYFSALDASMAAELGEEFDPDAWGRTAADRSQPYEIASLETAAPAASGTPAPGGSRTPTSTRLPLPASATPAMPTPTPIPPTGTATLAPLQSTPTRTAAPRTKTPTKTPTFTSTPLPSATPRPGQPPAPPTQTPVPTPTRTPTPTWTFTPTPSPTPTSTFTPTRTATPTWTFTPSHTPTHTPTRTPTPVPPTDTPTPTPPPPPTPTHTPEPPTPTDTEPPPTPTDTEPPPTDTEPAPPTPTHTEPAPPTPTVLTWLIV